MQAVWSRSLVILLAVYATDAAYGRCVLNEDESLQDLKGAFCSVNNLHLFAYGAETQDTSGLAGTALATDTSYFLWPKVSLHFKAYAKGTYRAAKVGESGGDFSPSTDQAFIHFGHKLEDPIQLSVGRLPLPFGLRHEILRYELPQRTEVFWDRSVNGAVLSWRAKSDFTLDIGGTNKNEDDLADKEFSAFTIRATQHMDLLSGTKLIGSYQNHGGSTVGKMGLATIVFYNDDLTSIEWVRIAENWKTQTYQQLFRFVYQNRDEDKLWTFEYDDIRRDSWRMVLSVGKNLTPDLVAGGAIQYERQRFDRRSNWVALLNLNYALTVQSNLLSFL
ncbi:MAG: hypothetical protein EOP07_08485 [Proteobacteria bacterium]|nr:MAG: hypothetical protein EOP07_08485 [Pseudomonadota bacterium]